jgi:hypothetical protein
MTKLVLDNNAMQEDFIDGSALIGIVTAQPGYRFCWMLNKHFDINLVRDPEQDICVENKNGIKNYFPIYEYLIPNSQQKYLLYKLKDGAACLLPETKNIDYLWLVQTARPEEDAKGIVKELLNFPEIQLAKILDPSQLKTLSNLLI